MTRDEMHAGHALTPPVATTLQHTIVPDPIPADAEKPLETLRTIHSFDPCMACACHTFDPAGKKLGSVEDL